MTEDTMSGEPSPRVSGADIRTFLFADMRGYTRFTQEHGDEAASGLASRFAELVREAVPAFEGELLELRGDEALCVFRSARQALRASVELQRRLRTGADDEPAFPIGVGIGLDAGEAVPTQGGYRGASLNLAARLCALAKPGEILATETVAHFAHRVDELRFLEGRTATLKGMPRPVRYVVVEPEHPLPPLPRQLSPHPSGRRRTWIAVLVLCAAGISGLLAWRASLAHTPRSVPVRGNTVAIIDPKSGAVVRDLAVGNAPVAAALGFGAIWVANENDDTVTRIDVKTHQTLTTPVNGSPTAISVGDGAVWAYDTSTGRIFQLDPAGNVVAHYRLPACCGSASAGIAAAFGRVWVTDGLAEVFTLDATTRRLTQVQGTLPADGIVVGNGYVYTAGSNVIEQINPTTPPTPQNQEALGSTSQSGYRMGLTASGGQVWAVLPYGSDVARLDATLSLPVRAPHAQPPGDYAVTIGAGALWVTNIQTDSVYEMTARQLAVIRTIHLPTVIPTGAVFADGQLWITLARPQDSPTLHFG